MNYIIAMVNGQMVGRDFNWIIYADPNGYLKSCFPYARGGFQENDRISCQLIKTRREAIQKLKASRIPLRRVFPRLHLEEFPHDLCFTGPDFREHIAQSSKI